MGFGISDETMERIRDSLWYDPSTTIRGTLSSRFSNSTPRSRKANISPRYIPKDIPQAKPSYTDLNPQERFLASTYYAIQSAHNQHQPKSQLIGGRLEQMEDYYLSIFKALNLDTGKISQAAQKDFDPAAGDFLISGFVDMLLPYCDLPTFSKPDFRNAIDDIFSLANLWQRNKTASTNRTSFFYNYVQERYGLHESDFFCCPYCGTPLIQGIAFCPKCLENSRDTTTPRYKPLHILKKSRQEPSKAAVSTTESEDNQSAQIRQTEDEKRELIKQLELFKEHSTQAQQLHEEKLKELQNTITKLNKMLEERDQAISAMKQHISGTESDQKYSKNKILIFGATSLDKQELQLIANDVGLEDIELVCQTDYVKLKQYAARIKKDTSYVGIILGPTPHKIKEEQGATSPSAYFSGAGFPFTIEAKTYSGQLKLTRESLHTAFHLMYQHLLTTGYFI